MEEADIRFAELKKAQYEFNRDIVTGAVNPVGFIVFFRYIILYDIQVDIKVLFTISDQSNRPAVTLRCLRGVSLLKMTNEI